MFNFLAPKDSARLINAVGKTNQRWFSNIKTIFNNSEINDSLWEELEEILISSDVGVQTTQKIINQLKSQMKAKKLVTADELYVVLRHHIEFILDTGNGDNVMSVTELPLILLTVGVNGVGKTTSIAKLANSFVKDGRSVILGAADTFRAAAIDQLQIWGDRLGIEVVSQQPGADPGSVAFDTIQAARSRKAEVAIIDTAGRLHNRTNLMEELKKIQNVIHKQGLGNSQKCILTIDATTGQNGLVQAKSFCEFVNCDGVFLTKLDGTAKGGIVLAISDELNLPILFVGTGEHIEDFASFDPVDFTSGILGDTR